MLELGKLRNESTDRIGVTRLPNGRKKGQREKERERSSRRVKSEPTAEEGARTLSFLLFSSPDRGTSIRSFIHSFIRSFARSRACAARMHGPTARRQ